MNKKYLLAFGAFLIIVSVVFLVSHKTTQQGSTTTSQTAAQLSPQDITKNFYSWYVAYPSDPVTSKEFKNNPYLTASFKQQSQDLNDPTGKYDPVFCKQNQMVHVAYQQENNSPLTDVVIHQDTIQGTALYRVVFAHSKGQWQISDIVCMR